MFKKFFLRPFESFISFSLLLLVYFKVPYFFTVRSYILTSTKKRCIKNLMPPLFLYFKFSKFRLLSVEISIKHFIIEGFQKIDILIVGGGEIYVFLYEFNFLIAKENLDFWELLSVHVTIISRLKESRMQVREVVGTPAHKVASSFWPCFLTNVQKKLLSIFSKTQWCKLSCPRALRWWTSVISSKKYKIKGGSAKTRRFLQISRLDCCTRVFSVFSLLL